MEKLFERSIGDASRLAKLTEDDHRLFRRVDEACDELLVPEFERYMERRFDDKVPEILRKHRLMGIPVSKEYGGDGAGPLVHALTMERFGQLGLGVVTFVDVHQALGCLTIQDWGTEEQKRKYLTRAATGELVDLDLGQVRPATPEPAVEPHAVLGRADGERADLGHQAAASARSGGAASPSRVSAATMSLGKGAAIRRSPPAGCGNWSAAACSISRGTAAPPSVSAPP